MLAVDKKQMGQNSKIWEANEYYDMAEDFMEGQWRELIWPIIKDCKFGKVVDLAAGHGRNTQFLLPISEEVTVVDICTENLAFIRNRFEGEEKLKCYLSKGADIKLQSRTIDLVYCFDAMVHFEPETVYLYLKEIASVLKKGGHAFLHHSNYAGWCNNDWRYNPHARSFMHWNLFQYWARRSGLEIVSSKVIDWVETPNLDRLTLLRK